MKTSFEAIMEAMQDAYEDYCRWALNKFKDHALTTDIAYGYHKRLYRGLSGIVRAATFMNDIQLDQLSIIIETREQYTDEFYRLFVA